MTKFIDVKQYEEAAAKILSEIEWRIFGETHMCDVENNMNAFRRIGLRPQVLNDVSGIDVSTTILGSKIAFPVCIAPTAFNKVVHSGGEVAVAKAAAGLNTCHVLSVWSTATVAEIEAAKESVNWLQIFVFKNRDVTIKHVREAEKHGFRAIVVSVDSPASPLNCSFLEKCTVSQLSSSLREKCKQHLYSERFIDDMVEPSLQWKDIEWLKGNTKLPVVLKGILTADMARKAAETGVDGIIVSNYAVKHLGGVPAAIDALPEVAKAVQGKCEVYLDGGIRSGTDILKAVGLGAKAVFVGRLPLWGLACNGEDGVRDVMLLLRDEFKSVMQFMGCLSIQMLQDGEFVVSRSLC